MHATNHTVTSTVEPPQHEHGRVLDVSPGGEPPPALVALALSAQAGCGECVAHHARQATTAGATRRELLEALGTALLLSRDHAEAWAPLADAALEVHGQSGS